MLLSHHRARRASAAEALAPAPADTPSAIETQPPAATLDRGAKTQQPRTRG